MRRLVLTLIPLSVVAAVAVLSVDGSFYLDLLESGKSNFNRGNYAEAAKELRIASFGLLDSLENYETALLYLALSQQQLGNQQEAATAVRRILEAENIAANYQKLAIDPSPRQAFEQLAASVLTREELALLLRGRAATEVVTTPRTETVAPQRPPTPAPSEAEQKEAERREAERLEALKREEERLEAQRREAERLEAPRREAERLEAQRREEARLESERREAQRREAERREAERREAERLEAERRLASQLEAERREMIRRETERREAERREAERLEAERRAAQQRSVQPVEPQPSTTRAPVRRRVSEPQPTRRVAASGSVRRDLTAADQALQQNDIARAHDLYSQLLHTAELSHDALLEVARGLYQTGDFESAITAFTRLGTIRPGEEEYHYYAAVALFETGNFTAARKQLTCALPYIELNQDVARYQAKIEGFAP